MAAADSYTQYATAIGYLAANKVNSLTSYDTAVGYRALANSTSLGSNTAVGADALLQSTGGANTALGRNALGGVTTGWGNIGIGALGGQLLTTGDSNIAIGNQGVAGESHTIRIGDSLYQTRAFIVGIRGVTTGNANAMPVLVDSAGQLGTANSSRRVKRDIRDMGDTTEIVMGLHPVRFRFKAHGANGHEQYGLVAEEVAEVAPELVARDKDGQIETVFYDKVNAMLLNEVQKQHRLIRQLESRLAEVESGLK